MTVSVLRIVFLNVGHGDSIVIEHELMGQRSYGVIDSNVINGKIPAIDFLHSRGASKLAFAALTHLHSDHFQGLAEIVEAFPTEQIFLTPHLGNNFADFLETRLPKFKAAISKLAKDSDSAVDYNIKSLVRFLLLLKKRSEHDCLILCGPENHIEPSGFAPDTAISVIQPLAFFKGKAFQKLLAGEVSTEHPDQNELSLAFKIDFAGYSILLGGDTPAEAWGKLKKTRRGRYFNSDSVKLPHHGSDKDNTEPILQFMFGNTDRKQFAIISANGSSHPAPGVLKRLKNLSIEPLCTNMAECCYTQICKNEFAYADKLDQGLKELLFLYNTFRKDIPCQGNIELEISSSGEFHIKTEKNTFCPNRMPI